MPLVNAKCTNCGGTLTVDASKEAAICDFCGSPYIVEKAIQNYNYYVTQNIKADNVNVTAKGEAEKERLLHNAETYTGFKDYKKALEIYKQVTEDYPDDYRGWYGLIVIHTENFEYFFGTNDFNQLKSYMDRVTMTAPPDKIAPMQEKWEQYQQDYVSFKESKANKVIQLQNQSDELQQQIKNCEDKQYSLFNKIKTNEKTQKQGIEGILTITGFAAAICFIVTAIGWLGFFDPSSYFDAEKGEWYTVESSLSGFHNVCRIGLSIIIPLLIIEFIIHFVLKQNAKKSIESNSTLKNDEYNKQQQLITEKNNIDNQINEIKNLYSI